MKRKPAIFILLLSLIVVFTSARLVTHSSAEQNSSAPVKRYLYVAVPGIRDYLGYGGHGILVFDIDNNHKFVKRIPTKGFHPDGKPSNVKGLAVSIPLNSIYVSTIESLQRIDLTTGNLAWEKKFEGVAIGWLFHQTAKPCIYLLLKIHSGTWWIVLPVISSKKYP